MLNGLSERAVQQNTNTPFHLKAFNYLSGQLFADMTLKKQISGINSIKQVAYTV